MCVRVYVFTHEYMFIHMYTHKRKWENERLDSPQKRWTIFIIKIINKNSMKYLCYIVLKL